jgi:hypothetical protein
MRLQFVSASIFIALSVFLTQTLSAAQALAVAGNGKWDMEYDAYGNVNAVAAKAIAACRAKGGTDPKIVWSQALNVAGARTERYEGAIAISDNGSGSIVGWSFTHGSRKLGHADNAKLALNDCRKKGGQNPKVVATF